MHPAIDVREWSEEMSVYLAHHKRAVKALKIDLVPVELYQKD